MAPLEHDIYGIDIETDRSRGTIDPSLAPIRAIGLSIRDAEHTFTGDETSILRELDERLAELQPGILATWNGAIFDLPYIADRARLVGVALDLVLFADRRRRSARSLLPGHDGAYRATWGAHRHLDTFRLYGDSGSSGSFATLFGLPRRQAATIASTDDLVNEAMHAHAASDARLARVLAERRRQAALRLVDHIGAEEDAVRLDQVGGSRVNGLRERIEQVRLRPAIA